MGYVYVVVGHAKFTTPYAAVEKKQVLVVRVFKGQAKLSYLPAGHCSFRVLTSALPCLLTDKFCYNWVFGSHSLSHHWP